MLSDAGHLLARPLRRWMFTTLKCKVFSVFRGKANAASAWFYFPLSTMVIEISFSYGLSGAANGLFMLLFAPLALCDVR